jgi:predicted short-subunit dehydrogenase-like oxidoreductase (DUF2520 family)
MATPKHYRDTFDLDASGQAVLAELIETFGGPPFAAGQPDQTAYNCGTKAVIEHILAKLDAAARDPVLRLAPP